MTSISKFALRFISGIFGFLLKVLNPGVAVGGMDISDSYVRFIKVDKGKAISASLRLPPNIIADGKVVDKVSFKKILSDIKQQLGSNMKGGAHVVLTVPSSAVYLQVFNLPYLSGSELEEAAKLNIQMMSPSSFDTVYWGWEIIDEKDYAGGQFEIIGAFSDKDNMDFIINACREAGFNVVVSEPAILAIIRTMHEVGHVDTKPPSMFLYVSNEGMDFAGVKNNRAFFDYFVSWRSLYGDAKEVPMARFEEAVLRYVRQVLNFSTSRGNPEIKELILLATALSDEFKKIIEKNFDIKVTTLSLRPFEHLDSSWSAAVGAYERGLIPRVNDNLISLSGHSTEEIFKASQILAFVRFWRNVVIAFGGFLVAAFLATYIFTGQMLKNLEHQNQARGPSEGELSELRKLKDSVHEFNSLATLVGVVRRGRVGVHPYLEKIDNLSSGNIKLGRILFQSLDKPVTISGEAAGEGQVIAFKNLLEQQKEFKDIQLPISSITHTAGDKVSFSITLRFIALNVE